MGWRFILVAVIMAGFIALTWWARIRGRKHVERLLNHCDECATCGYMLRGLPIGTACPECGGVRVRTSSSSGVVSRTFYNHAPRDGDVRPMPAPVARRLVTVCMTIFMVPFVITAFAPGWPLPMRYLWMGLIGSALVCFVVDRITARRACRRAAANRFLQCPSCHRVLDDPTWCACGRSVDPDRVATMWRLECAHWRMPVDAG